TTNQTNRPCALLAHSLLEITGDNWFLHRVQLRVRLHIVLNRYLQRIKEDIPLNTGFISNQTLKRGHADFLGVHLASDKLDQMLHYLLSECFQYGFLTSLSLDHKPGDSANSSPLYQLQRLNVSPGKSFHFFASGLIKQANRKIGDLEDHIDF